MLTLYRKYRPQNFTEIVGQNHIKMVLQHEVESGKVAHAYLFCGPRAVGKTTFARVMAKAVNCLNLESGKYEPCGTCDSCQDIAQGKSLDMIEIDAASHTGVDNVRENIIASSRVSPSKLKRKIFIIDEVHMLSISAFNALLKTLEEPPEKVIFILCTTEIHKVPATIISRCQRFDFKKISLADQVKRLNVIATKEEIKIDKRVLEAIARNSGGHMRDAESLLGQLVTIGGKKITEEEADLVIPRSDLSEVANLIDFLARKDGAGGIRLINKMVDEGVDLKIFTNDLIEILRKLMLIKINPSLAEAFGLEVGEALELKIGEVNKNLSLEQLILFIEQFMKTVNEIKGSFIIQLPIELAIAKLCQNITVINPPESFKTTATIQKKEEVKPATPALESAKNGGIINYEEILEKWNELLVRIKKYNHSLSFILRVCQPKSLKGNELCLAFKYKFHKDRVNDPSIKQLVEQVLLETYNTNMTIETIIDENLEVDNGSLEKESSSIPDSQSEKVDKPDTGMNGGVIDNLLKTFGGKVVG
ncbi:MAG: polymerase III gamma/tau subunit protein [Parcubacteria group bacterium GW2011_GWE2_39_37]|uniref:DNA polymerase III subunit gamma/tau n=1 Tax=Candidatus Falkowbacteria bacterium GW2011_GWF2_39_8 TaxID=1618642 RepID=A0A0G0T3M8_9BACT|nr:MAG: polymerase III gamma/tau subunit protein [Parcubacteria group bacterium GW2011_GWE2_39_37]KKR32447.1 MAG: polymerase III gamma/tau subunit protein [Candidatus Falkowbacteria bacterium GW2011_GWF2_39_8]